MRITNESRKTEVDGLFAEWDSDLLGTGRIKGQDSIAGPSVTES
jgi:hypothetical protein